VQKLIPFILLAGAAKARACRALQTLRDVGRAAQMREASGVRRIPPLFLLTALSKFWNNASSTTLVLAPSLA